MRRALTRLRATFISTSSSIHGFGRFCQTAPARPATTHPGRRLRRVGPVPAHFGAQGPVLGAGTPEKVAPVPAVPNQPRESAAYPKGASLRAWVHNASPALLGWRRVQVESGLTPGHHHSIMGPTAREVALLSCTNHLTGPGQRKQVQALRATRAHRSCFLANMPGNLASILNCMEASS